MMPSCGLHACFSGYDEHIHGTITQTLNTFNHTSIMILSRVLGPAPTVPCMHAFKIAMNMKFCMQWVYRTKQVFYLKMLCIN